MTNKSNKPFTISMIIKLLIAILVLTASIILQYNPLIPDIALIVFPPLIYLLISYIILLSVVIIYRIRHKVAAHRTDNITAGISNLFRINVFVAILYLILSFYGISITKFFTSISIVAAAIAIISKEYISSIISGFIFNFTKIININDYVLLNDKKARIKDITLTKVYLENDQGELIIINNDVAYFSEIINYSQSNKQRVNIPFELSPSHLKSVDEFEEALIEQLNEFEEFIEDGSILLRTDTIEIDKFRFTLYYTLSKLEPQIEKSIRKKTIRKIVNYIQANRN